MGVDSFVKKRGGVFLESLGRKLTLTSTFQEEAIVSDKWILCVSESVPIFSELDVTLLHVDFAWSLQEFDYLIN